MHKHTKAEHHNSTEHQIPYQTEHVNCTSSYMFSNACFH